MEPNMGSQDYDFVFRPFGHFAGNDVDLFRVGTPRNGSTAVFYPNGQIEFIRSNLRNFRFNNLFYLIKGKFIVFVIRFVDAVIGIVYIVNRNNRTTHDKKTKQ